MVGRLILKPPFGALGTTRPEMNARPLLHAVSPANGNDGKEAFFVPQKR